MKKHIQSLVSLLLLTIYPGLFIRAQSSTTKPVTRIAIVLFPGVELLDFAGPLEVFNHMEGAQVYTVATQSGPMRIMQNTLTVTPDHTLTDAPQPDILVVPGGNVEETLKDTNLIQWIQQTTPGRKLTMSVCTGTYILGKAHLLEGKTVTTHWAATQMLQQMNPKTTVMEHTRFVDQGNLVTTAGVSAGIDGALHVVSRLKGIEAARIIARIMEYDKWEPEDGLIVGKAAKKSTAKTNAIKPSAVKKNGLSQTALKTRLSSDIDPVCQMSVAGSVVDTVYFGGKTYGFCSRICKQRFKQQPTAYLKR